VRYSTNRPLLNGNMNVEYIAGLMEKRRALYESAADVTISTDKKTTVEIVKEILQK
jgi:shikimate kinase